MDVGLVACSRIKTERPAPACELYCSPLFRAARLFAEQHHGRGRWMILSARYGLVDPQRMLEPYDQTLRQMSQLECRAWGERVASELARQFPADTTYWLYAGALYRQTLIQALPNPTRSPLVGLRIGQQLAWYRRASRSDEQPRANETPGAEQGAETPHPLPGSQ
jgi:hypothetical protein